MDKLPLQARFALVFGLAGFILSLISGLIASVGFGTAIFRAIIFLLVFAGMGFGFHTLIKSLVPQLLEEGGGEEFTGDEEFEPGSGEGLAGGNEEFVPSNETYDAVGGSLGPKKEDGNYGDHIIVEGVKLENEPKLMAEAIRTMMAKDEE